MAYDRDDELNRRRQERESRRQQRLAEQRKMKIRLIIAAVVLLVCGIAILAITGGSVKTGNDTPETTPSTAAPAPSEASSQETESVSKSESQRNTTTVIHIKAAGDLNVTDNVVLAGAGTGGYDFTQCFQDVAPVLSDADLTILNLEGNLCGEPYGTSTTSAPIQLAQALQAAGVDLVQMANSCAVNNGISGLVTTLSNLRSAGLEPVGAFSSAQEFQSSKGYTICEVQGVKVAVVAFTKGVGSRGLPVGSEDCVNLLYTDYATTYEEVDTDGIKTILKNVASEKPDITIALLHWGSEYNDTISSTQTKLVDLLQKQGVDIILGTHSHMVHQVSYDEITGNLVAYSLGDFFGDASRSGTNYSIILDIEITKDSDEGTTKVTDFSYTPIYTVSESEAADGVRRVVRIQEAMYAYENKFLNMVSSSAYSSMEYALERIEARVNPQEDTE